MNDPCRSMSARRFDWAWQLGAVLVTGGCLLAWPTGAQAQINPFRGYRGPTLNKDDLDSGRAAAVKLLNDDEAQVGKSRDWAGPASGNTGSISVQRAFQRRGMECRALRTEIHYRKTPTSPPRVFNLDVCRTQAGEWKLM